MLSKEEKYLTTFEICDYFVDLGTHIAYYRKKVGFKQQELADRLHIDRTYLSRIESPVRISIFHLSCSSISVEYWMYRQNISLSHFRKRMQNK